MLDQVQFTTLPNGARVITAPQADAESVAVGFWVGVGGRHETPAVAGASHFIEHMLFKGTRRRTAKEISQAIEGRGGYLNAYTQEDATCYYARIPHERLGEAFDVLADMYCEPKFAPADIDRERGVIIEELRMGHDQPQQVVQEQLMDGLWSGHPLGRPLVGTERTLKAMARADLDGFRRRHYQPGNTVFGMAGRLAHATCVALVKDAIGRQPAGRTCRFKPVDRTVPQERFRSARRKIEQVHAAIGFRGFGRHDHRRFALRMLNSILGENMSSRLFQIVREKHGLAYAVQSSFQLFDETGATAISAGLDRARAADALRLIAREVARMRAKPVSRDELQRARDYLQGQFRLGLEGTGSQMQWIGDTLMNYGRFVKPEEVLARLMAVTAEEMRRVAAELFVPRRLTLSLVVPETDPADEKTWLKTLEALG
jgi:predicted Zn-dependent peptidase